MLGSSDLLSSNFFNIADDAGKHWVLPHLLDHRPELLKENLSPLHFTVRLELKHKLECSHCTPPSMLGNDLRVEHPLLHHSQGFETFPCRIRFELAKMGVRFLYAAHNDLVRNGNNEVSLL